MMYFDMHLIYISTVYMFEVEFNISRSVYSQFMFKNHF